MNNMLRFMLIRGYGVGSGIHIVRARARARTGAMVNISFEEVEGRIGSLMKSLIASAKGCRRP